MVQTVVGERREQGVRMGTRCFFDANTDSQVTESFANVRLAGSLSSLLTAAGRGLLRGHRLLRLPLLTRGSLSAGDIPPSCGCIWPEKWSSETTPKIVLSERLR